MIRNTIKIVSTGLLVFSLAGFIFIWFGFYNIAANEKHWDITTALLEILREHSIDAKSDDLTIPNNINSKELIAKGAGNYAEMCVQCHLSPGVETSELNEGLYPQPPVFHKRDNTEHSPKEMFWVIKNGIKLTGMPAWGNSHTDEQIWEMVAFISKLDKLSPADYKNITANSKHSNGGHDAKPHH